MQICTATAVAWLLVGFVTGYVAAARYSRRQLQSLQTTVNLYRRSSVAFITLRVAISNLRKKRPNDASYKLCIADVLREVGRLQAKALENTSWIDGK